MSRAIKGVKGLPKTHGQSRPRTPEYTTWGMMKSRCLNPKNKRYNRYGGRGITICARWLESFQNFYDDMGARPAGTSLERRDNDGNYEPLNCYWATPKEQQNNTCFNVRITHNGETKTVSQWAQQAGIPEHTFRYRLIRGWSIDEALSLKDLQQNPWKRGARTLKLTNEDVIAIRLAQASGELRKSTAKRFSVSVSTVSDIVNGRTWRTSDDH